MDIQKINALITRKLEAEVCPVHGCHPTIVWINGNLQIVNPCCDEFAKTLYKRAGNIAHEEAAIR